MFQIRHVSIVEDNLQADPKVDVQCLDSGPHGCCSLEDTGNGMVGAGRC